MKKNAIASNFDIKENQQSQNILLKLFADRSANRFVGMLLIGFEVYFVRGLFNINRIFREQSIIRLMVMIPIS
jgi:hypothetical protein